MLTTPNSGWAAYSGRAPQWQHSPSTQHEFLTATCVLAGLVPVVVDRRVCRPRGAACVGCRGSWRSTDSEDLADAWPVEDAAVAVDDLACVVALRHGRALGLGLGQVW